MQCLALKRAYDKGACETFADSGRLRQVEVAAAPSGNREQALELFFILAPKFFPGEATGVVDPS